MNAKDLYWPILHLSIFIKRNYYYYDRCNKIALLCVYLRTLSCYLILPNTTLIISTGVFAVSETHKLPNPKKRVIDRFKSFQFSVLRPLSSLTSPLPIQLDQKSLQRSIHPSSTIHGSLESRISSTELQYFSNRNQRGQTENDDIHMHPRNSQEFFSRITIKKKMLRIFPPHRRPQ